MAGTLEQLVGTEVPFAEMCDRFIFTSEQFWGRAARASWTRKSLRALVIFGVQFCGDVGASGFWSPWRGVNVSGQRPRRSSKQPPINENAPTNAAITMPAQKNGL
jgi:hypothetical protein